MRTHDPFARIVVGLDRSVASETALRQAVALAEKHRGAIVAVHVSDSPTPAIVPVPSKGGPPPFDPRPLLRSLDAERREVFDTLSRLVEHYAVPVWMEIATDGAASGILDAARRWRATSIAVGTHARSGIARFAVGSVAEDVLRRATVPVIVTRANSVRRSVRRVLVGVDAAEHSHSITEFALALAHEHDVALRFCTAIDTSSVPDSGVDASFGTTLLSGQRTEALATLDMARYEAARRGIRLETEIAEGDEADVTLCEIARRIDADAIVVGKHQRGDLEWLFLGGTADALIRRADCPVMVVPTRLARALHSVRERRTVSA
ncbi:MAG: universal stress protein [Candidatus Velthaea sp.]|jgi:nucleotide-binding universal stress UspA family protein